MVKESRQLKWQCRPRFREVMQSVNKILSKSDQIHQPSQTAPQIILAAPQGERFMHGQNEVEQHWREANDLKNDENNNVIKNSSTGRKTSTIQTQQESSNQDLVEDVQNHAEKIQGNLKRLMLTRRVNLPQGKVPRNLMKRRKNKRGKTWRRRESMMMRINLVKG